MHRNEPASGIKGRPRDMTWVAPGSRSTSRAAGREPSGPGHVPYIPLNNGIRIPQLGFGVYRIAPGQTQHVVLAAFGAGYRHIDTAQRYGNEKQVARALARSGLSRDEVFLTRSSMSTGTGGRRRSGAREEPGAAWDRSRRPLPDPLARADRHVDTWTGFEEVQADGSARAIGVSNPSPCAAPSLEAAHLFELRAEPSSE